MHAIVDYPMADGFLQKKEYVMQMLQMSMFPKLLKCSASAATESCCSCFQGPKQRAAGKSCPALNSTIPVWFHVDAV